FARANGGWPRRGVGCHRRRGSRPSLADGARSICAVQHLEAGSQSRLLRADKRQRAQPHVGVRLDERGYRAGEVHVHPLMPFGVAADVTATRALSADYNVLALAAPAIAAAAAPGQFVMVKLGSGHDPLLRRPFSIFEVLLGSDGSPAGITLLNKRI